LTADSGPNASTSAAADVLLLRFCRRSADDALDGGRWLVGVVALVVFSGVAAAAAPAEDVEAAAEVEAGNGAGTPPLSKHARHVAM